MFGNLRKYLEEVAAQVNPFDQGKTAATVRRDRQKPEPAKTVRGGRLGPRVTNNPTEVRRPTAQINRFGEQNLAPLRQIRPPRYREMPNIPLRNRPIDGPVEQPQDTRGLWSKLYDQANIFDDGRSWDTARPTQQRSILEQGIDLAGEARRGAPRAVDTAIGGLGKFTTKLVGGTGEFIASTPNLVESAFSNTYNALMPDSWGHITPEERQRQQAGLDAIGVNTARNRIDQAQDFVDRKIDESRFGVKEDDNALAKGGAALGNLAGFVGAAAATGGAAIPAMLAGLSTTGDAYTEAIKGGASPDQAAASSVLAGGSEAALERVGLGRYMKATGPVTTKLVKRSITEGTQEASQSLASSASRDIYADVDYGDAVRQAVEEGAAGAFAGGVGSLPSDFAQRASTQEGRQEIGQNIRENIKPEQVEARAQELDNQITQNLIVRDELSRQGDTALVNSIDNQNRELIKTRNFLRGQAQLLNTPLGLGTKEVDGDQQQPDNPLEALKAEARIDEGKVFYHGTSDKNIKSLKDLQAGSGVGKSGRNRVYVTENPEIAKNFGDNVVTEKLYGKHLDVRNVGVGDFRDVQSRTVAPEFADYKTTKLLTEREKRVFDNQFVRGVPNNTIIEDTPGIHKYLASKGYTTITVPRTISDVDGIKSETIIIDKKAFQKPTQATAPKDGLEALKAEARKYKSAEEFAQDSPKEALYRGTTKREVDALLQGKELPPRLETNIFGEQLPSGTTFTTDNISLAKNYSERAAVTRKPHIDGGYIIEYKPEVRAKSQTSISKEAGSSVVQQNPNEFYSRDISLKDVNRILDKDGKVIYEAPKVSSKAPERTVVDDAGNTVTESQLLDSLFELTSIPTNKRTATQATRIGMAKNLLKRLDTQATAPVRGVEEAQETTSLESSTPKEQERLLQQTAQEDSANLTPQQLEQSQLPQEATSPQDPSVDDNLSSLQDSSYSNTIPEFRGVARSPKSKNAKQLADRIISDKKITKAAREAQLTGESINYYAERDPSNRSIGIKEFDPRKHRIEAGFVVDENQNVLGNHIQVDDSGIAINVGGELINTETVTGNPLDWEGHYKVSETMERNIFANAPNEQYARKTYDFVIKNKLQHEAQLKEELAQQRTALRQRVQLVMEQKPDNTKKKEFKEDIFDYIERKTTEKQLTNKYGERATRAIKDYDRATRKLYDDLLERVNRVFERFGEPNVEKRKDYITHIQELTGSVNFAGELYGQLQNSMLGEGRTRTRGSVPGEIAGRTADFQPRKKWNQFFQPRQGDNAIKDPFAAVDAYLEPTLYNIHMTEPAVRARAIEAAFRTADKLSNIQVYEVKSGITEAVEDYKQKPNKDQSKLVTGFQEYANALAGKTQRWDRQAIDASNATNLGLRGWQSLQRVGGAATIVGNVQSVLMQPLNQIITFAQTKPSNYLRGIGSFISSEGPIEQSAYIKARATKAESDYRSRGRKAIDAGGVPLQAVEIESVKLVWHTQYQEALDKGLKGKEAIAEADRLTERLTAGRGIADKPEVYRSTISNGLLMYTLEVNAQNKAFWKDLNTRQKAKFLVAASATNMILAGISGYEPLPDFLKSAIESVTAFFDDEDERSGAEKTLDIGRKQLGEVVSMNPLTSAAASQLPQDTRKTLFGEDADVARFEGTAAPVKVVKDATSAVVNLAQGDFREARNDLLRVIPYGNQTRKTVTGAEQIREGYQKSGSGNIQYLAPDSGLEKLKALIFGPYSTSNAQEYFANDRRPLGKNQSEYVKDIPEADRDSVYERIMQGRENDRLTQKAKDEAKSDGFTTSFAGNLSDRADKLKNEASVFNKSLKDVIRDNNLPEVSNYEKAAAHLSGKYEDFVEAYNLDVSDEKMGSGEFSELIERNTASEKINKAKALYRGYEEIPEEIKERYYKEAGVSKGDIEQDIASGFKVVDKAKFIADEFGKLPYEERLNAIAELTKPTVSGKYFASYGTIDELVDLGVISKADGKRLKNLKWDGGGDKAKLSKSSSSPGSSRGGSRGGNFDYKLFGFGTSPSSIQKSLRSILEEAQL